MITVTVVKIDELIYLRLKQKGEVLELRMTLGEWSKLVVTGAITVEAMKQIGGPKPP